MSGQDPALGGMATSISRQQVKLLSLRSNLKGISAISRDTLLISLIIFLDVKANNLPLYLLSLWAIGALQFAMSECLLHEAAHRNLFRWRRANDLCEVFVGLPFFQTVGSYRAEHRLHHIYPLQERDRLCEEYVSYGLEDPRQSKFWLWFIKPVIGYSVVMMKSMLCCEKSWLDWLKLSVFWIITTGCFYYFDLAYYLIVYWLVPLVFCKGAFLFWSEVSDHYNTSSGTRTRIGLISNFIFHNNGYHHAHHRYPSITQFNLKKAHRLACREGDDISHGFFDTYLQIRGGNHS
jgi:fatty acid desaturase